MKKRYRDRALNELLARLQSDDFDGREYALFQLALLLRRANRGSSDLPEVDGESLPRELQRLRLSAEEQRRIVDQLTLLIARRQASRATAFWTLNEFTADVGWTPALAALEEYGHQLNDEAALQACRALRRWLTSSLVSAEQANETIGATFVKSLIVKWAAADDNRLSKEARAVLDRLCPDGQQASSVQ
ncbi:MAG: hypothetical protein OXG78_11870 [Chloroflexi bacterium]|nr:hypothetical protein [Chloroflexota bacterium]